MLTQNFLDQFSLLSLFVGTVLLMVLAIEIGYRVGKAHKSNAPKAQTAQVRAIMGAVLGLLAFMLAFTFASAQSHFELRIQGMVDDSRIASNAFMQADFLEEPAQSEAKALLHQMVSERLEINRLSREDRIDEGMALIENAETIQRDLWDLAKYRQAETQGAKYVNVRNEAFMNSIIALRDTQNTRLHTALSNRIPTPIWTTLYFTALLSMVVMGYQAGLTGKRSPIATVTLAIAFSAVMVLITDLDRPRMSMFDIDNQIVVNLKARMEYELGLNH